MRNVKSNETVGDYGEPNSYADSSPYEDSNSYLGSSPKEHLKSVQFQWVVALSQIQRQERTLRELRITALVMSVVLFLVVLGFFGGMEKLPSTTVRIMLVYGSVW